MIALLLACTPSSPTDTDRVPPAPETGETGAPTPTHETTGVRVVRAPSSCPDPTARASSGAFETFELGLDWTFATGWRTPTWDVRYGARGIVVGDFDADGHLDVIVPQELEKTRILMGAGDGSLAEEPDRLARNDALLGPIGGATADWDADGDLDVFLYGQLTPPVLLTNDGTGFFEAEIRPEWDVNMIGCGGTAAFADADVDGDIDLFYGRMGRGGTEEPIPCENRLILNESGVLVDRSELLPAEVQAVRGTAGGFHQFDTDVEPELYVVALAEEAFVSVDLLLDRQPDGTWVALRGNGLDVPVAGMGMGAADVNADGLTDVAVAGFGEIKYLMSVAPGVWADAAQATGLVPDASRDQIVAWGGEFADFDLDGWLDLAMTFGTTLRSPLAQPDEIWLGSADGTYLPTAEAWGVADLEVNRGFVVADLDEDGWPDWLKRELGGVLFVDVSRCGEGSWLEVRLKQPTLNPDAIGARIRVFTADRWFERTIVAGSTSFTSGGPPVAMFGLAGADRVEAIEVLWPDGAITSWGPQEVDQVIELTRPM